MGTRSMFPNSASPWPMAAKSWRRKRNGSPYGMPVPARSPGEILPDGGGAQADPAGAGRGRGRAVRIGGPHTMQGLPNGAGGPGLGRAMPLPDGIADAILRLGAGDEVRAV